MRVNSVCFLSQQRQTTNTNKQNSKTSTSFGKVEIGRKSLDKVLLNWVDNSQVDLCAVDDLSETRNLNTYIYQLLAAAQLSGDNLNIKYSDGNCYSIIPTETTPIETKISEGDHCIDDNGPFINAIFDICETKKHTPDGIIFTKLDTSATNSDLAVEQLNKKIQQALWDKEYDKIEGYRSQIAEIEASWDDTIKKMNTIRNKKNYFGPDVSDWRVIHNLLKDSIIGIPPKMPKKLAEALEKYKEAFISKNQKFFSQKNKICGFAERLKDLIKIKKDLISSYTSHNYPEDTMREIKIKDSAIERITKDKNKLEKLQKRTSVDMIKPDDDLIHLLAQCGITVTDN